jgi:S-adenosylmethionine:tRNA ribosyltransferase-isomerase
MPYLLSDFDFTLPADLIAQQPPAERGASRLLHVAATGRADLQFRDLPQLLRAGDLLVINDARVVKARLLGYRDSGGRIEALIERIEAPRRAWALVRSSHAPRPGSRLLFGAAVESAGEASATATVLGRDDDRFELEFDTDVAAVLERHGQLPLPPYIDRAPDANDEARYQTVYARAPGAVATPTAGLHFDPAMLDRLQHQGVELARITLDVGAATFQPVRSERIDDHRMHAERYEISPAAAAAINAARAEGRRVIAIGTTSLRALESAAIDGAPRGAVAAGAAQTRLFVTPGFRFRIVDRLLTNFHLPRSTLLILVSAFAGIEPIRAAYQHAIAQGYRFFSYGDAMLLERGEAR